MSDALAARLRTVWPLALGHVAAFLGAWLFRLTGVEIDSVLILEGVSLAASWGVWEAGRYLEARANPIAKAVGRWLISAGKDVGAPTYGVQPTVSSSVTDYHDNGSIKQIQSVMTWPKTTDEGKTSD